MKILPSVLLCTAALQATFSYAATEQTLSEPLAKDIHIMKTILQSGLEKDLSGKPAKINTHYLPKQGILFVVKTRHRNHSFWHMNLELNDIAEVPEFPEIPPIPDIDAEEFERDIEEFERDIELGLIETDSAAEKLDAIVNHVTTNKESLQQEREQVQQLKEQKRELKRERRRIKHSDLDTQQKKESLQTVNAQLKEVSTQIKQRRDVLKKQRHVRQQQQTESRAKRQQLIEQSLLTTLCQYGRNLNALSEDEHVTLLLTKGHYSENKVQDKVWVFNKNSLNRCDTDELDEFIEQAQVTTY